MNGPVEQVKNKLSILDVVGEYVKLTKSGKHYKGLSPFTKEKTPSFFVSLDRGSYYCFSTNQGGDIFTFIEKMEGLDFKGALKVLADKAGVSLVQGANTALSRTDTTRTLLSKAQQYYTSLLTPESEAYQYALQRGVTPESVASWGLGYAPEGWRHLLEHLSSQSFSTSDLSAAGLIKEADEKKGTWYDRFRNRLMFPIYDSSSRVVAFTGRALAKDDLAKYLNSPEIEVFKKGEVLYGFHKAKDAIRRRGFVLLTEGQFDVVMLHQIGFENAVALSGTALTDTHITLLMRYTDSLMLALDSDKAGRAATFKHALNALTHGMRVKVVAMPLGKDPADVSKEDPKEFAKYVQEAKYVVQYFLDVLSAEENDGHKLVRLVEQIVLPLIAVIKSPLEKARCVQDVARTLGVSADSVMQSVSAITTGGTAPKTAARPSLTEVPRKSVLAVKEERLVALRQLVQDSDLAKEIESRYSAITGRALSTEISSERLLFEIESTISQTDLRSEVEEVIRSFHKEHLQNQLDIYTKQLRHTEASLSKEEADALLSTIQEISETLHRL